jgi:diaminopropionate ammonia-lyase
MKSGTAARCKLVTDVRENTVVQHFRNPHWSSSDIREVVHQWLPFTAQADAAREVRSWSDYERTRLLDFPDLAADAAVAQVWIKDEAPRFGLGSFKALGGAYAVSALARNAASTSGETAAQAFACATDGNHGRAVAWGARRLGCRSVIYLHERVSAGREAALRALGAEIVRVAGTYDDSVRQAAFDAARHGWTLVSDTSNDECDPSPLLVMAGYTLMVEEIVAQLRSNVAPTHIFVQAGVGGLAASVIASAYGRWMPAFPRIVTVEPQRAACVMRSLEAGRRVAISGSLDTVMAGLACGEVSHAAWPMLKAGVSDALTISEVGVPCGMRLMFRGTALDPGLTCGESGGAGIVALLAATRDEATSAALGLHAESRVLLISTEGATDREIFERLVPDARQASA